jgi:hypothetical protein
MDNPYIYVLVREDLPCAQRVVQAGHLLWEASRLCEALKEPRLIVCRVGCEQELKVARERLSWLGSEVFEFREPDLGCELTAIGAVARTIAERARFRRYPLLL